MKTTLIGIAAIAALSLTGMAANANCSYPSAGNSKHISPPAHHFGFAEHEGIVGTWLVDYGPVGQAFIQWHSDNTEWENINHPTFGGNICMGSWVATGPWTFSRNHFGWIVQGPLLGFPVSGRDLGGLQHIHDLGPSWLTGEPYGPDAGLIGIAFRFIGIALVLLYATSNHGRRSRDEFVKRIRTGTSSSVISTI